MTNIVDWMSGLPQFWAYLMIFVVAYMENVIPPIPGDMLVVFGGYLVGIGTLQLPSVVVLATIGGAAGFMTMYSIGTRVSHAVLVPKRLQWLSEKRMRNARRLLGRWGFRLVVANRFLSGLRSVISLTVGMMRMQPWKTLACATASALVWTTILAAMGYFVGDNWPVVESYLGAYGWFIMGGCAIGIGFYAWRLHKARLSTDTE